MKLLRIMFPALLAISGCEKSSNVSAMQDEATGIANHYRSRFEELSKRYIAIDKSDAKKAIEESKDMKPVWSSLQRRLGELRNATMQAQNSIAAAAKGQNPSADLIRLQADMRERFERGETEVVGLLHTVESWVSSRAYAPKVATAPTPAPGAGSGHDAHGHDAHGHENEMPKTGVHPDEKKDAPKSDAPQPPDAKPDGKTDAKKDAPKTDGKTDAKKDAPKTDAKADAPKADAPKKDAPKADAPKKDAPKAGAGSGR